MSWTIHTHEARRSDGLLVRPQAFGFADGRPAIMVGWDPKSKLNLTAAEVTKLWVEFCADEALPDVKPPLPGATVHWHVPGKLTQKDLARIDKCIPLRDAQIAPPTVSEASRIEALEARIQDLEWRLKDLEKWRSA